MRAFGRQPNSLRSDKACRLMRASAPGASQQASVKMKWRVAETGMFSLAIHRLSEVSANHGSSVGNEGGLCLQECIGSYWECLMWLQAGVSMVRHCLLNGERLIKAHVLRDHGILRGTKDLAEPFQLRQSRRSLGPST
jgi:hypothetical protein